MIPEKMWKNILPIVVIGLVILSAQVRIRIPHAGGITTHSNLFVSELLVLGIGFYAVFINLVVRKKIKSSDNVAKCILLFLGIFCVYFFLSMMIRILTGGSLAGSVYLPRIIIEAAIIFLSLKSLDIEAMSAFKGLIVAGLGASILQLFVLFRGSGVIRGSAVFGNSNVYVLYMLMLVPILVYMAMRLDKWWKVVNLFSLVLQVPIFLLSGSRIGFTLLVILSIVSFWLYYPNKAVKRRMVVVGSILLYSLLVTVFFLNFGNSMIRNNTTRSIAIPNNVLYRVTAGQVNALDIVRFTELSQGLVDEGECMEEAIDISEKTEEEFARYTAELSNIYRADWNRNAMDLIVRSPATIIFGSGVAVAQTYVHGYQSPHNFLLQYLLPFGIIGTLICFIILFAPLIATLRVKKYRKSLIILPYATVLLVSWNQPLLGNMIICFALMIFSYAVYTLERNEIKEDI